MGPGKTARKAATATWVSLMRPHACHGCHFQGRVSALECVASLDGGALFSASYDGAVRSWRAGPSVVAPWTLESEIQLLRGEGAAGVEGRVLALAACQGGESVLCGSGGGTIYRLGSVAGPEGLQLLESLSLGQPSADGTAEVGSCLVGALAALELGASGQAMAVAGTSDGRLVTIGA